MYVADTLSRAHPRRKQRDGLRESIKGTVLTVELENKVDVDLDNIYTADIADL